MANEEQLILLKQRVEQWNNWRKQHPEVQPDLCGADLICGDLCGANLSNVNLYNADLIASNLNNADLSNACLSDADLRAANLRNVNLYSADLHSANLHSAHLSKANLKYTNFSDANLINADLHEADLIGATFIRANLKCAELDDSDLSYAKLSNASLMGASLISTALNDADLSNANLSSANLNDANLASANLDNACLTYVNLERGIFFSTKLDNADLSGATMGNTILYEMDLRKVKGLSNIYHEGPSLVELYTIQLPQDGSALHFLRGVGVPDEWIDILRSTMMYPIQYHSCFISYSNKDDILARRLHADLQDYGVRCWFAPHDMKIGDKIRPRIDEAIHLQEKLLLLLSEHSLASAWVEAEVEAALEKEQQQQREMLFPIRLDESVMQTRQAWAAALRRTRHIGDFTRWTEPTSYQVAFERLLRDLKKVEDK